MMRYKQSDILFTCLASCAALLAIFVYAQLFSNDFIILDSERYIVANPRIQSGTLVEFVTYAFTTFDWSTWQPLTWLSYILEYKMYGLNPSGYHLTSFLLQLLNSLLLGILLTRITNNKWASLLAACVFLLHPLNVEPVAWEAERKDGLSMLFLLLTLLCYLKSVTESKSPWFWTAIFCYACGLMAKPVLVTLPLLLLLLDFWPLERWRPTSEQANRSQRRFRLGFLLDKIPFVVLAALSSSITYHAQVSTAAAKSFDLRVFWIRLPDILFSYVVYLAKMVFPQDLALYYPVLAKTPVSTGLAAAALLVCVTGILARNAGRKPCFFVGWLWVLIAFIPMIQIVQVGSHAMADRYCHVPLTGMCLLLACGLTQSMTLRRIPRALCWALVIVALLCYSSLTKRYLSHWKNTETLFTETLKVTPGNYVIYTYFGFYYWSKGDKEAAYEHLAKAISINASWVFDRFLTISVRQYNNKEYPEAISTLSNLISATPNDARAFSLLGDCYAALNDHARAAAAYLKAMSKPNAFPAIKEKLQREVSILSEQRKERH